MKYLILIALSFCTTAVLAQLPSNNSCATAIPVCQNIVQEVVYQSGTDVFYDCSASPSYYFSFNVADGQVGAIVDFTINDFPGTYVLYGPSQESELELCSSIGNNSAPFVFGNLITTTVLPALSEGLYVLQINPTNCHLLNNTNADRGIRISIDFDPDVFQCNDEFACENCVPSFAPTAGDYMVSAWVKEDVADAYIHTYQNSELKIAFTNDPTTYVLTPAGEIIDGWQRIEGKIAIPAAATDISISLVATSSEDVFFDDIRFYPFDGSMMSYVYDPESLRLMAELDERNYATLYEYDEEGKLIRVKKETERGVMTIQENRDNIKKQE